MKLLEIVKMSKEIGSKFKNLKLGDLYKFIRKHKEKTIKLRLEWYEEQNPYCHECEASRWKGHGCEGSEKVLLNIIRVFCFNFLLKVVP
jgi:hypothetical protein